MANRRFLLGILAMVLVLGMSVVALMGCATPSNYILYTDNANKNFTILGEIVYTSSSKYGYIDLLNAARAKYPDCDYVIDLMIDKVGDKYSMRGTAIKYR